MAKIIGIIGCGFIGSTLAEYTAKNLGTKVKGIVLYDVELERSKTLAKRIVKTSIAKSMEKLFDKSDLIIESATGQVVPKAMKMAIKKERDIMIMSVGGLLGNEQLLEKARKRRIRIIIPSGAICGIDGLKALKIAGIKSVTLTTRKNPKGLEGAPYLIKKGIDPAKIKKETIVFEGPALEAVKFFPQNINVSLILSIAGIGARKTRVRIVASPEYTKNIHEIRIEGQAGTVITRSENVPSPRNPKTSYLAALAAIASLKEYFDTVRIGT